MTVHSVPASQAKSVNKMEAPHFDSFAIQKHKGASHESLHPSFSISSSPAVCQFAFWFFSFLFFPLQNLSFISSMTHLCLSQLHFNWSNPLKCRINLELVQSINSKYDNDTERDTCEALFTHPDNITPTAERSQIVDWLWSYTWDHWCMISHVSWHALDFFIFSSCQ